jgi:hypothetical protein
VVDESSADTEEPVVVRATGLVRVSAGGAGFDPVPVARRETKEMGMIEYDNGEWWKMDDDVKVYFVRVPTPLAPEPPPQRKFFAVGLSSPATRR